MARPLPPFQTTATGRSGEAHAPLCFLWSKPSKAYFGGSATDSNGGSAPAIKRRFLAVARNDSTDRPVGQLGKYLS
jgi:hypothetical protein